MLLHCIYTPLSILPVLQDRLLETLEKENLGSVDNWCFLRRCNFYENNSNFQIFFHDHTANSKKLILELVFQKISQSGDKPTLFLEILNNYKKPLKSLLILISSDNELDLEAQKIVTNIIPIFRSTCEEVHISKTEDKDNVV